MNKQINMRKHELKINVNKSDDFIKAMSLETLVAQTEFGADTPLLDLRPEAISNRSSTSANR
jgi:hypothetical protein